MFTRDANTSASSFNPNNRCYRNKDTRTFLPWPAATSLDKIIRAARCTSLGLAHRFLPRPLETKAGIEEHLLSVFFVLRVPAIKCDRVRP